MHGSIGWMALVTAMAAGQVPQPGLSRAWMVAESARPAACRADDADDERPLEISVTLRNTGGAPTTHLVAWPVPSPDVIDLPAPAAFGAIEPGASVTRTVRFAGYGSCARPDAVAVTLVDRSHQLGTLSIPLRAEEDGRD
ncbi:MAG: hypothetical protein ABW221_26495 [Vicinamibacteria bacterium]